MIDLDVKKVGRIPDGGGCRAHGCGSTQDLAATNAKDRAAREANRTGTRSPRGGYVYLHCAIDGYSHLAYTEHLADEKAATTIGFWACARAFFAAHGIARVVCVITDNGANCKAAALHRTITATASRHQRIRPYTPRHNGRIERYNRILAEEFLYSRLWTSKAQRAEALKTWNFHYNYHRDHTAIGNQPPASRLPAGPWGFCDSGGELSAG